MVTGCIWEKVVFGRYLFAPAFYWEDVFSMLVLALHTAYLVAWANHALDGRSLMPLALAAYASYVINATQFLLKLRAARLEHCAARPRTSLQGARMSPVIPIRPSCRAAAAEAPVLASAASARSSAG
jgi:hypothetical protein